MIRRAKDTDIDRLIELLGQVLEVHAAIRPDIFRSGTTKYSREELSEMIKDDNRPVFVYVDEKGTVVGYAFCQLKEPNFASTMVPRKSLFVDDLCVDEESRGAGVAAKLFDYVKNEAKSLGCHDVTLCVWEGNRQAERFYEKQGMKVKERVMEYIL